jgi:hypothetical protein
LRRRNRVGLKRIGILALALVIALGSLGVAYSAWTDTVYVNCTVQTGTLDIDIAGCSSTFVYKVPNEVEGQPPEIVVHYGWGSTDQSPPDDPEAELIASAVTTYSYDSDADTAVMTFNDIFPGIDFKTDVLLEYVGTVPAKVSVAEIYPDNEEDTKLTALWALGEITKGQTPRLGAWIDGLLSTNDGGDWTYVEDIVSDGDWSDIDYPLGLQLHQGDLVHVTLHVNIPQDPLAPYDLAQFKNISTGLGFTGKVTVIQWNEYEE